MLVGETKRFITTRLFPNSLFCVYHICTSSTYNMFQLTARVAAYCGIRYDGFIIRYSKVISLSYFTY
jgi:hypothetical protein